MTDDDARAVAELFSSLVGAMLAHMRLTGQSRHRMQQFLQHISDSNEAMASDATLQEAVRAHLAVVAQILPPNDG